MLDPSCRSVQAQRLTSVLTVLRVAALSLDNPSTNTLLLPSSCASPSALSPVMSDASNDDSLAGLNRPLVSSDFPSLHSLVQDSGDTTPFNSPKIMANLSRAYMEHDHRPRISGDEELT